MKYGKLAPTRPAGLKDLDAYFKAPLAAPPASVKPPGIPIDGWGMLGNGPDPTVTWTGDGFNNEEGCGDCTKAGEAHAYDALTWDEGLKEAKNHPNGNQVVSAYFAETGGVDSGLDCGSVLQKAYSVGAYGQKIGGYGPINYKNTTLLKQLVASFGVAYIGIQCPESAEQQANENKTWSVVPGSPIAGGHCIIIVGYDDATGLYAIVSWGRLYYATYEFIETYMDEAWGLLAPAIATKGEFDKIDFVALEADLAAIAPLNGSPALSESHNALIFSDVEGALKRLYESVPNEVKDFTKLFHKVLDAALERESVEVLEKLFGDALKAYTHGLV
jgi:hypothetical protein